MTRLWEYLDHALAAEEAAAVRAHLGGCARCRPVYRCDRAFLALVTRARGACPCAPPTLVLAVHRRILANG